MKITVEFTYWEGYLPTKRHKKLKWREALAETDVNVPEVDSDTAPVVFKVKDFIMHASGYEVFDVRQYNGRLYRLAYKHDYYANAPHEPYPVNEMVSKISRRHKLYYGNGPADRSKEQAENDIRDFASRFLVVNGEVFHICGEPIYGIYTYGLGHNHGGTSLSVDFSYNGNISANRYFTALQKDDAIAEARRIASARGDTDSLDRIGDEEIIVLDPNAVTRNPAKDHGNGDPYLNKLEDIMAGSSSSLEAGFRVVTDAFAEKDMDSIQTEQTSNCQQNIISVEVNNCQVLQLTQSEFDGNVTLHVFAEKTGEVSGTYTITPGDLVTMCNWYRYQKGLGNTSLSY